MEGISKRASSPPHVSWRLNFPARPMADTWSLRQDIPCFAALGIILLRHSLGCEQHLTKVLMSRKWAGQKEKRGHDFLMSLGRSKAGQGISCLIQNQTSFCLWTKQLKRKCRAALALYLTSVKAKGVALALSVPLTLARPWSLRMRG